MVIWSTCKSTRDHPPWHFSRKHLPIQNKMPWWVITVCMCSISPCNNSQWWLSAINAYSTFNRTCNDKADVTGVKSNLWYKSCLYSAWLECTLLDLLAHKSNNVLCSLLLLQSSTLFALHYYFASFIKSTVLHSPSDILYSCYCNHGDMEHMQINK